MNIFSHNFFVKIVLMLVWKRSKINEKEAGDDRFKNNQNEAPV